MLQQVVSYSGARAAQRPTQQNPILIEPIYPFFAVSTFQWD